MTAAVGFHYTSICFFFCGVFLFSSRNDANKYEHVSSKGCINNLLVTVAAEYIAYFANIVILVLCEELLKLTNFKFK